MCRILTHALKYFGGLENIYLSFHHCSVHISINLRIHTRIKKCYLDISWLQAKFYIYKITTKLPQALLKKNQSTCTVLQILTCRALLGGSGAGCLAINTQRKNICSCNESMLSEWTENPCGVFLAPHWSQVFNNSGVSGDKPGFYLVQPKVR